MVISSEYIDKNDKQGLMSLIRKNLSFPASVLQSGRESSDLLKREHYRFDMSGYDYNGKGSVTIHNQTILNKFAHFGIYDHHQFIALDFYKGQVSFFTKSFMDTEMEEHDFSGLGTCEIIYEILQLTIFSNNPRRRRD